jgi:uncharacterized protein (TIGR02300 family)
VTKSELGTKRFCNNCNMKFYDLHKSPIVCPTCKTVLQPPTAVSEKPRRSTEVRTVFAEKPAKDYASSDNVPDNGSDENPASEKDEEDAGVDDGFEDLNKE